MNNVGNFKDQSEDSHNKHLECFQELNQYLQKLSKKLTKDVENMEAIKLEQFKEDLIKTKSEFDEMNQKRKEKAIKKAVYSHKKQLEKQCSNFLQKSIEVNKIYEGLKQKLVNMASSESELDDEIKYLHKQIRAAAHKNQSLKRQYNEMQQYYQQEKGRKIDAKGSILVERTLNTSNFTKNNKQIEQIMNRTKKWEQNTQERLKIKIENTKELIDSIVFQQSTLEELFLLYDPLCYREDKKKLLLMQNFLSQDRVKRQLYELLFKDDSL